MASTTESNVASVWASFVVVGLVLLALGFAWPLFESGPSEEEKTKAAEFLDASRAMEAAASARTKEERSKRMAEVREQYRQARDSAEQTRSSQGRIPYWLKVVGGILAAIGCAGVFLRDSS